jgi:hypothetical protein
MKRASSCSHVFNHPAQPDEREGQPMKATLIVALCLGLAGCNHDGTTTAEDQVRQQLRDPSSAEFTNIEKHIVPDKETLVVCGYVNSRNGFGGMSGPRRFVAGATAVVDDGTDISSQVVDGVWSNLCPPSTRVS